MLWESEWDFRTVDRYSSQAWSLCWCQKGVSDDNLILIKVFEVLNFDHQVLLKATAKEAPNNFKSLDTSVPLISMSDWSYQPGPSKIFLTQKRPVVHSANGISSLNRQVEFPFWLIRICKSRWFNIFIFRSLEKYSLQLFKTSNDMPYNIMYKIVKIQNAM